MALAGRSLSAFRRYAKTMLGVDMGEIINFDLLSSPVNWIIVFLILYFLALLSHYVMLSLGHAGVAL